MMEIEKEICKVQFVKSRRANRISITVKPFRGVRVTLPFRMSLKDGQKFFDAHLPWVERAVAKIRRIEQEQLAAKNNENAILWVFPLFIFSLYLKTYQR